MKLRALAPTIAFGMAAAAFGLAPAARALPPPDVPISNPTVAPTAAPVDTAVLPLGSPIDFVLDDTISSSKSQAGSIVHMHLKNDLIVNNVKLAPAGTPATLRILGAHRATAGDNDGSLQIAIPPLDLPDRGALPIRANHEYLTIDRTGGQLSTRSTTDTITDVFVPGAVLSNALRKGRDFVLPPGSVLRAQTAATVDAHDPQAIVVVLPRPMVMNLDAPHADFTPSPIYTPQPAPPPKRKPTPKPSPTAPPPTPAAVEPVATPSPTGTA